MESMRARDPRTVSFLCVLAAAFALVVTMSGCASGPRESARAEAVPPTAVENAGATAPVSIPDDAITELLLAREQAREGLLEEADASYARLLERLATLAEGDSAMRERIASIEAERERVVELLDARQAEAEEVIAGDEALDILEGPEPEFHPGQGVEEAAVSVEPDWPVVKNERVLAWIEAYTGRLSGFFAASLERSGKWEARFREIFAQEGVPQDLVYLAHTESGFKTSAYSRAHARGVFQFISGTAKRYGMRIDTWVDERADPEISARASASYLRDLYEEFGCWSLALASYNGGEGRVRRAIARSGGERDFWQLTKTSKHFRRETRNYVPAIMAATLIAKDPAAFGFGHVQKSQPTLFETVVVPTATDIEVVARVSKTDVATLRELNPALRRGRTPPGEAWTLRVPVGASAGFAEELAKIPENERIVRMTHVVRRGETLSVIARRYGTSVSAIQGANRMGRRTMLHPGQELEIPRGPGGWVEDRGSRASEDVVAGATKHRVRRGETLSVIARRYGVTIRDLQAWNGMGSSTSIVAGSTLRVVPHGESGTPQDRESRAIQVVASGESYTVRRGDSAWAIANAHGVKLEDLLALNGLTKRSKLQVGQRLAIPGGGTTTPVADARETAPQPASDAAESRSTERVKVASGATTHVVRRGDTAWSISQKHGVDLDALLAANGLTRRSKLRIGQALVLPQHDALGAASASHGLANGNTRSYVVRRGDTLARIAELHGTTVDNLCRINSLRPTSTIYPGDRLAIP